MESSMSSQEVTLTFVIPDGLTEESCAPSLICAYQACAQSELNPHWLSAEECFVLKPSKQDVFVCEPFEGNAFNYLKSDNFKSVVLGPRCLLSCLHRKISIPELPSPIHNISMHKLVITLTGFEKEEKEELRTIITRSSGVYSNNFSEAVTHLVANTVGSKKYIVAIEKEIPIMTGEWLRAVWKAVCKDYREDIYATDDQFLSYNCPMFKNLVICVSQMPRKAKDSLKKIIEENGGIYSTRLEMAVTSVLILPTPEGEKFEHAQNWRIQCLTPDWIYDSAENGHALKMEGYEVKRRGASTPVDENATNVPPDVSICSTIMNETALGRGITHVNETLQMSTVGEASSILKRKSSSDEHVGRGLMAVEELDLQEVIKARNFLDGCKIYLSGFDGAHMDKLRRAVNAGGATRFRQLTESVSHVIIGKIVEEDMNTIMSWPSKPHVVYADWVTESMKLKKPADEAPFSYCLERQSSPKRPRSDARRSSRSDNNETFVDEALINKYLKPRVSADGRKSVGGDETMNVSAFPDSQQPTAQGIYHGKVFTISGYNQRTTEDYITLIREHCGEVVSLDYKGRVDYSVTNIEGTGLVHSRAAEVVSLLYLQDCFDVDKWGEPVLLDVQYFHLPLHFIKNLSPLADCTFAISNYSGLERQFLVSLATCLGAQFQESFAKKSNPAKNIKASTHLICPTADGEKYKAALKWKVPAVTHDWLLGCVRSGQREPEDLYRLDNANRKIECGKQILRNLFNVLLNTSNSCVVEETVVGETPINAKVRALLEKSSLASPHEIKTPDIETIRKMYPTPGVSRGDDSLDEMSTPDTPYGRTWYPDPPPRVRKKFKKLLNSLPDEPPLKPPGRPTDPGTPIEEYYKRFQESVREDIKNYKPRTPVWLRKDKATSSEKCNNEDRKTDCVNSKFEDFDTNGVSDKPGPLVGVVIYAAHKHQDQQRALYEAVGKLGGDYRLSLDQSVTHYICQGQNKTKEFRIAQDEGKIIVSPDWVWMCQDEQKRVDEELFPHTQNSKMALSIVSTKNSTNSKRGRPKQNSSSEDSKSEVNEEEDMQDNANDTTVKVSEMNESLSKQLEEIEAMASVSGSERRSLTRSKSISEKLKHTPTRAHHTETQPAISEVPETQSTAITWDDPQERQARRTLHDQLTRDTQEIINENMQAQSEESEEDKENLPTVSEELSTEEPSASPKEEYGKSESLESQYNFVISGVTDEEKERYVAIIIGLGGHINNTTYFSTTCTHVVTAKPTRSEKHLAAIASGKWLLYTSFLEHSGKAGRFVEEEPHEWGNPSAKYVPSMDKESIEYKLASCSRRWRLTLNRVKNKKRGAFHGMKALIHSNRDRIEAFTRLIQAGGGEVISAKPPYRDVVGATHFFIELNKHPLKIDLASFASRGIPCLSPIFLNEYLVKDPLPNESDHLIPEYMQILKDMSAIDWDTETLPVGFRKLFLLSLLHFSFLQTLRSSVICTNKSTADMTPLKRRQK